MLHTVKKIAAIFCIIISTKVSTNRLENKLNKQGYTGNTHKNLIHKNAFLMSLCASAAYLLAEWFFSDQDQTLLINAEKTVKAIIAEYYDMLAIIDQHFSITFSMHNSEHMIQHATEQEIYDLAHCMLNKDCKHMQASLVSAIHQLSALLYTLDAQEQSLEDQGYHGAHAGLLHHLQDFMSHMLLLREKLKFLRQFLIEHETYFSLFEVNTYIQNKYQLPLTYLNTYTYDQNQIKHLMRSWALSSDATIQSIPQMSKVVQSDILLLKQAIMSTNSDYTYLLRTAQKLTDTLISIKTYLTIDPLYSIETAANACDIL